MTFKLQVVHQGATSVLKIDGALTREGRTEFLHAVQACGKPLQLDLTDLRSADEEMLHIIWELREGGRTIVGASPYIAMCIEASSTGQAPTGGTPRSGGPAV
jgi:hypothetical protein